MKKVCLAYNNRKSFQDKKGICLDRQVQVDECLFRFRFRFRFVFLFLFLFLVFSCYFLCLLILWLNYLESRLIFLMVDFLIVLYLLMCFQCVLVYFQAFRHSLLVGLSSLQSITIIL